MKAGIYGSLCLQLQFFKKMLKRLQIRKRAPKGLSERDSHSFNSSSTFYDETAKIERNEQHIHNKQAGPGQNNGNIQHITQIFCDIDTKTLSLTKPECTTLSLESGTENAHQDWGQTPVSPGHPVSQEAYEELSIIADKINLSPKNLMDAFCASVSSNPVPPEMKNKSEYEILASMLEKLIQLGKQSTTGKWPIFEFISHLIKYISQQPLQKELVEWLEKYSKEINTPLPEESTTTIPAQDASFHLLVKFELNCFNEDEVYIKAWFLSKQNGKIEYLPYNYEGKDAEEEEPCPLANAHTRLGKLILYGEEAFGKRFTIELFLPFTLLNHNIHDVHQWNYCDDLNTLLFVAHEHPLVLRSYERVYQCRPQRDLRWKENEEICKKCEDGRKELPWTEDIKFVREESYEKERTVYYEDVPCLVLTFVPPKYDTSVPQHIFKKMISAGISVALWPRSGHEFPDQDAIEQECQTLLEKCEFSEIPEKIWKTRKVDPEDKTSIANYLTLFWDHRCRLPPDAPDPRKREGSK